MEQQTYSVKGKTKLVQFYFATESIVHTQKQFVREFPKRKAPSRSTIYRILDKFKEVGSVQGNHVGHSGRPKSSRTESQIEVIRQRLQQSLR